MLKVAPPTLWVRSIQGPVSESDACSFSVKSGRERAQEKVAYSLFPLPMADCLASLRPVFSPLGLACRA